MEKLEPIIIDPKTFLREHCSLPTLPRVVQEIQDIIKSDNVEITKVSQAISKDPALVAQILKVVNSAYYSLPREIAEVRYAIAFLGLHEVARMVLALSVINALAIQEKGELTMFWYHSFYAALCTKYLAAKYEPQLSFEELWSAGMLHDIGKLVYLRFFPEHYKAIRQLSGEKGYFFSDAEQELSLPASAYFGVLLCDHWRLPAKIREACEAHSLQYLRGIKGKSPADSFKRMICLGNLTAILSVNELSNEKKPEIAQAISASLECSEAEFLTLMGEIYDLRIQVDRFMEQFG